MRKNFRGGRGAEMAFSRKRVFNVWKNQHLEVGKEENLFNIRQNFRWNPKLLGLYAEKREKNGVCIKI